MVEIHCWMRCRGVWELMLTNMNGCPKTRHASADIAKSPAIKFAREYRRNSMKRWISLCLVAAWMAAALTACGAKLDVDKSTIYVQKKGKVVEALVEPFEKSYYEAEELERYINERVEAYTAEWEKGSVKASKLTVEDGVAKLQIEYGSYEDFARFNGEELFEGTAPQAVAAGYPFDTGFLSVEGGVLGEPADAEKVTADPSYRIVILSAKEDVKVDGTVLFVSDKYTSMAAKDTVSIALPEDAQDGEGMALVYIVYKQ